MGQKSFKIQTHKAWPLVLGLDVGPRSLKYLLLRRKGKRFKVEGFGRYSIQNGETDTQKAVQQAVNQLFRGGTRFKKARTVLGVDGPQVVVKKESFPPLSKKELLQTISFEIQRELGKEGEASSFVFDYCALGQDPEKGGNVEYLTMGVPDEVVAEKIDWFVAEGNLPTKVTPYVAAIGNLVQFLPEESQHGSVGILDIGAQRSKLVFFKDGKLDFFREIIVGGDDFTKAITGTVFHEGRAIQFSMDEAMDFKTTYGYPLGFSEGMSFQGVSLSEVGAMMRPVVERLTSEIQRSIGFYVDQSEGSELEALYLVGGGARLKHLSEVLTEELGVPVSLLPFPSALGNGGNGANQTAFQERFLEQAVSLSLAMDTTPEGNLLPESYKQVHRTTFLRRSLLWGALGVFGLILFLTWTSLKRVRLARDRVDKMERRVARYLDVEDALSKIVVQKNALEEKMVTLSRLAQQDEGLIQVLRLFSHAVPPNISLVSLTYGEEKSASKKNQKGQQEGGKKWAVRLRGISRRPPSDVGIYVAQLIVEMKRSGYFSDVELVKEIVDPETGEYGFELVGFLKR